MRKVACKAPNLDQCSQRLLARLLQSRIRMAGPARRVLSRWRRRHGRHVQPGMSERLPRTAKARVGNGGFLRTGTLDEGVDQEATEGDGQHTADAAECSREGQCPGH